MLYEYHIALYEVAFVRGAKKCTTARFEVPRPTDKQVQHTAWHCIRHPDNPPNRSYRTTRTIDSRFSKSSPPREHVGGFDLAYHKGYVEVQPQACGYSSLFGAVVKNPIKQSRRAKPDKVKCALYKFFLYIMLIYRVSGQGTIQLRRTGGQNQAQDGLFPTSQIKYRL